MSMEPNSRSRITLKCLWKRHVPSVFRCHAAGLNSGPAREQTRSCVRRLNSLTRGTKMAAVNKGKWKNPDQGENNEEHQLTKFKNAE